MAQGLPAHHQRVPLGEIVSGARGELVLSGLNLLGSKAGQWLRYSRYKITRFGGNGPPFAKYTAL